MKDPKPPKVILMFSGLGSQYYQMGRELYDTYSVFKTRFDGVGGYLKSIIFDETKSRTRDIFLKTSQVFPSLFLVQNCLASLLLDMKIIPDAILGFSLGELSGMTMAGGIRFKEAFEFCRRTGDLFEDCPPAESWAILQDEILFQVEPEIFKQTMISSKNFPGHFCITGEGIFIHDVILKLRARDISCIELAIEKGFHTPLINSAELPFVKDAKEVKIRKFHTPFFSCCDEKYQEIFQGDHQHLWNIFRKPVYFYKTIQSIEKKFDSDCLYVDLSPSGTLATFVKNILGKNERCITMMSQMGNELDNFKNGVGRILSSLKRAD